MFEERCKSPQPSKGIFNIRYKYIVVITEMLCMTYTISLKKPFLIFSLRFAPCLYYYSTVVIYSLLFITYRLLLFTEYPFQILFDHRFAGHEPYFNYVRYTIRLYTVLLSSSYYYYNL